MFQNFRKLLSLFLSFCLILEQTVLAQSIDLSHYFANSGKTILQGDKFRPLHLRYVSYDAETDDFQILLDKGDFFNQKTEKTLELEKTSQELMKYFFIGLALPNEKFWVNLRPDSPNNILDPLLEKTDIGRIFLEADLQLKKDTSGMTSPQTKEGKEYWDKLYQKAGELFGTENITIPTITRPWIVPAETIIGESSEGAYIYKATLKVMLEEDYLRRGGFEPAPTYQQYAFSDPRLKELNEYSTQLIKETIIPKLTYEVNTSKRYAPLRQAYYSLILAQWFKQKYGSLGSVRASGCLPVRQAGSAPVNSYIDLIDSGNLANLASREPYDKQTYFKQYQKSFADGEYNLQEPIYAPTGQSIRRYISGGVLVEKITSSAVVFQENNQRPIRNYLISISNEAASPLNNAEETARELTEALFDPNRANERLFLWENTLTPKILKQIVKNINASLGDKEYMLQQLILRIITDSAEMKNDTEHFPSKTQKQLLIDIINNYLSVVNKLGEEEERIINNIIGGSPAPIDITDIRDAPDGSEIKTLKDHITNYLSRLEIKDAAGKTYYKESLTTIFHIVKEMRKSLKNQTPFSSIYEICRVLYQLAEKGMRINDLLEQNFYSDTIKKRLFRDRISYLKMRKLELQNWDEKPTIKFTAAEGEEFSLKLGEDKKFRYYWNPNNKENILYLRNKKNDIWLIFYKINLENKFFIGWFNEDINEFEFSDEDILLPADGIIDLTQLTRYEGVKRLLSSSSAAAEQPKKPYTDITKAVLSKIIKRNEELGGFNQKERENNMVENWLSDYLLRLELLSALLPEEIKTIFYPLLGDDGWPALFWDVIGTNKKAHGGAMPIMSDAMAKQRFQESNFAGLENREIKPVTIFNVDNFNYNEYFSYIKNVDALLIKGLSEYTKEYQDHSMAIKTALAGKPVDDYAQVIKYEIEKFISRLNNDIIKGGKYIIIADENDMWIGDFIKEAFGYIDLLNHPSYADIKTALDKYNLTITTYKPGKVDTLGGYVPIRIFQKPVSSALDSDKGGIDFSHPEILSQPIGELQSLADSPLTVNPNLDFEGEWRGIQMVFNSGIRPSARRLAEFAVSASASPLNSQRLEDLRGLVTDLLRRDEEDEKPATADPALKELLAIL